MGMTLMIEGITCAACTVDVQQALAALPGVQDVSVHYPEGHAVITIDAASPPTHEHLREAIEQVD
jgi:copper chaperone CopZ